MRSLVLDIDVSSLLAAVADPAPERYMDCRVLPHPRLTAREPQRQRFQDFAEGLTLITASR